MVVGVHNRCLAVSGVCAGERVDWPLWCRPWHAATQSFAVHLLTCRRPTSQQITGRMMNVARQEGLAVNEASMKALVEVKL